MAEIYPLDSERLLLWGDSMAEVLECFCNYRLMALNLLSVPILLKYKFAHDRNYIILKRVPFHHVYTDCELRHYSRHFNSTIDQTPLRDARAIRNHRFASLYPPDN